MAAAGGEPNWTQLPPELLDRIAWKIRDDVTAGVTLFRSVCRAWRAAARDAPRLLLPAAAPATRSCSRWPAGGAAAEGEAAVDSKDLQQQSKALDKLTDHVEDRQLDSSRVQSVRNIQNHPISLSIHSVLRISNE